MPLSRALYFSAFFTFAIFLFLHSWLSDDAYITFRVIDNFIHGYGLRWNIDERVQVYTHPLWMLLHIPFYAIFKNIYLITIALSFLCSVAAIWVVASLKPDPIARLSLLIIPLATSKAFVDFTSSGLENPLSFLLIGFFIKLALRAKPDWFLLSLIASLAAFNRMDTVLFYIPVFLYLFWYHKRLPILKLIAGATPLLAWLVFSFFYYGFLFPNTKYAKLNAGIPFRDYFYQGLHYLDLLFWSDTASFLILSSGFIVTLFLLCTAKNFRDRILAAAGIGSGVYCIYILCIGGDFMAGRFFSLPVFVFTIQLFLLMPQARVCQIALPLMFILASLHSYSERTKLPWRFLYHGITDERAWRRDSTTLFDAQNLQLRKDISSQNYQRIEAALNQDKYTVRHAVGVIGFYSGPEIIIIDQLALAEPFLARLPSRKTWRIGHFPRDIPTGFLKARQTGDLSEMEPSMAEHYRKLRVITRDSIFAEERLKTLWDYHFNVSPLNTSDSPGLRSR